MKAQISKDAVTISVDYKGHESTTIVFIPGERLDFVDRMLLAFDEILRGMICRDKFDCLYENADEGQRVVVDLELENLK